MRQVSLALCLVAGILTTGLFVGCKSGPTEQELFDRATAAQEQSDFPTAIKAYEELVQKYPKSSYAPKCQFMIGYLYANHLKNVAMAKEAYQSFIKSGSLRTSNLIFSVILTVKIGFFDEVSVNNTDFFKSRTQCTFCDITSDSATGNNDRKVS